MPLAPAKCLTVGARARLIRALQPARTHGSSLSPSPPPPPPPPPPRLHYYNKGDPIKHVSRRFTHTRGTHTLARAHTRAQRLTVCDFSPSADFFKSPSDKTSWPCQAGDNTVWATSPSRHLFFFFFLHLLLRFSPRMSVLRIPN